MKKKSKQSSFQSNTQTNYSGTQELLDSEEGLARYNHELVTILSKELDLPQSHPKAGVKLFEFGAGTGVLAEIWREKFSINPICIEIDSNLSNLLRSRGFETFSQLEEIPHDIQYLYSSNVLEHIEDDVNALKQIREKMGKDGIIAFYVPALPWLFSGLDTSIGHFRRYTKRELLEKVRSAGFDVQRCYYNDCLGVIASLVVKFFGYKKKTGFGSKKSLLIYDKYIYSISKILDKTLFKHVIGKNLLLIATNSYSNKN